MNGVVIGQLAYRSWTWIRCLMSWKPGFTTCQRDVGLWKCLNGRWNNALTCASMLFSFVFDIAPVARPHL